jgi:hypothetical protein
LQVDLRRLREIASGGFVVRKPTQRSFQLRAQPDGLGRIEP